MKNKLTSIISLLCLSALGATAQATTPLKVKILNQVPGQIFYINDLNNENENLIGNEISPEEPLKFTANIGQLESSNDQSPAWASLYLGLAKKTQNGTEQYQCGIALIPFGTDIEGYNMNIDSYDYNNKYHCDFHYEENKLTIAISQKTNHNLYQNLAIVNKTDNKIQVSVPEQSNIMFKSNFSDITLKPNSRKILHVKTIDDVVTEYHTTYDDMMFLSDMRILSENEVAHAYLLIKEEKTDGSTQVVDALRFAISSKDHRFITDNPPFPLMPSLIASFNNDEHYPVLTIEYSIHANLGARERQTNNVSSAHHRLLKSRRHGNLFHKKR